MKKEKDALHQEIDRKKDQLASLLQDLVRIPSATFEEGAIAEFVCEYLEDIGLKAQINELGDVLGTFGGNNDEGLFLLNTHLDQPGPGDMNDPYSAIIKPGDEFAVPETIVYGRGTNGQKASLAGMLIAAETIIDLNIPLIKGFVIHGGVLEECGGHISPKYLIEEMRLPIEYVLCAEHTNMRVVNRQRGMLHIPLEIQGKGGHAAAPIGTHSALLGACRAAIAIGELGEQFPDDPVMGKGLASLNKLHISPNIANVIPDVCKAIVDIRQPASIKRAEMVKIVDDAVKNSLESQAGLSYNFEIRQEPIRSYTGFEAMSDGCMYPFFTPEEDPIVLKLQSCLYEVSGKTASTELWSISSEAGYFSTVAKIPTVAFGPGEDRFTHNRYEHVRLNDVINCTKIFGSMILEFCA